MQNLKSDSNSQTLSNSALKAAFSNYNIRLPLYFYETTDSTNTRASELLKNGETSPFVIVAKNQTSGKGRFDRKWFDESGKSISLTLVLSTSNGASNVNWSTFCVVNAIYICNALRTFSGANLKIKWPNDIYIANKKLAGMIAETLVENGKISNIIFGIGLNFYKPQNMPQALADSSCDLYSNSTKSVNICDCICEIIKASFKAYDAIISNSISDISEMFDKLDMLKNSNISVNDFNVKRYGLASGINKDACLKLITKDGIFLCKSGEASIMKNSII